jgi:hypothetical protein
MHRNIKVIAVRHVFQCALEVLHVLHQNLELAFEHLVLLPFLIVHMNKHVV